MDDLREQLVDAMRQITSESCAQWASDRLLAAGWTKPPAVQQVEPAAHNGLVSGSSTAGRAKIERRIRDIINQHPYELKGSWRLTSRLVEAFIDLSTQQPPPQAAPAVQEQELSDFALGAARDALAQERLKRLQRLWDGDKTFGVGEYMKDARVAVEAYFAALRTQGVK